jgi:hypothetical protein
MLSNTIEIAAATRCGTALLGVRTPGADLPTAGANHARTQILASAAASPSMFQRGPAVMPQLASLGGELRPASKNRKQNNVHKTQIGVGYGAMGPQPEREPA